MYVCVLHLWDASPVCTAVKKKGKVLISAIATSSESAQTQTFGHKPTQSKKVQTDIHSKKNIFLPILESCIYVLDTLSFCFIATHSKTNTLFILWFLCNSIKKIPFFSHTIRNLHLPVRSYSHHRTLIQILGNDSC